MWAKLRSLITPKADHAEAHEALRSATESLQNAVSNEREVQQVVATLRYHRDVNHFAERIRASLGEAQ